MTDECLLQSQPKFIDFSLLKSKFFLDARKHKLDLLLDFFCFNIWLSRLLVLLRCNHSAGIVHWMTDLY